MHPGAVVWLVLLLVAVTTALPMDNELVRVARSPLLHKKHLFGGLFGGHGYGGGGHEPHGYGGGGYASSYAGSSAAGGGAAQSQSQSQSAGFSFGPFSASLSQSQSQSQASGGGHRGFFDY